MGKSNQEPLGSSANRSELVVLHAKGEHPKLTKANPREHEPIIPLTSPFPRHPSQEQVETGNPRGYVRSDYIDL